MGEHRFSLRAGHPGQAGDIHTLVTSIAAQRLLITNYPTSPKVPDALLNVASAQSDLNDNAAARRTLEELIQKYPQSEAALKAKQRLGMR